MKIMFSPMFLACSLIAASAPSLLAQPAERPGVRHDDFIDVLFGNGAGAGLVVGHVVVGDIRLGHGFRDDAEFDDAVKRDGKSVL